MMKKNTKKVILKTLIVGMIGLMIFSPILGLATTRRVYLTDFIMYNYDDTEGGFYEYKTSSSQITDLSYLATKSSLQILSITGDLSSKVTSDSTKVNRIQFFLRDQLVPSLDNNDTRTLAYCLEGLDIIDEIDQIESSVQTDILNYLGNCKKTVGLTEGFAYSPKQELSATVYGTYYVLKCYYHLGLLSDIIDETAVTNFIMNCLSTASVGKGFKSNSSSDDISLENTFYAIRSIDLLGTISSVSQTERNNIDTYLASFYVDDNDLKDHYGGYSLYPLNDLPFATMLATYYAATARYIVKGSNAFISQTEKWVLNHQNPADGGFMDNVLPGQEQRSSTIISEYATELLKISDPNLNNLETQVWTVDIDWVMISIISVVIIASVAAGIIAYRKRSQI